MSGRDDHQAPLRRFGKSQDFFVGVDSDGCAFDTMEVKHKECFIPNIVRFYGLAAVSKAAREAAEFVNLYSHWRGTNRFPMLAIVADLLADHPEALRRGFRPPPLPGLRDWIGREARLANPALRAEVAAHGDPDLALALAWSEAVNHSIGQTVRGVPPFAMARQSLEALRGRADVMVVSATPAEALVREWEEHGLADSVALIAGQEMGGKAEVLGLATAGRYGPGRVLMVGDAPGDRKAAEANGVLFYPINPGAEDESWQRFHDEALPHFFAGTYAGDYMRRRLAEFEALLPSEPPWKTRRPPAGIVTPTATAGPSGTTQ